MARKMTECPSKRGPISQIMPSDGCKRDSVPLAVGRWYDFHEFGYHLGNVGLSQIDKVIMDRGVQGAVPYLPLNELRRDRAGRASGEAQ